MNRSALVSLLALPLVACMGGERNQSGECPAGEVCSPKTPYGLLFGGTALAGEALAPALGPPATAIGGTQNIALYYDRGDGIDVLLDLPYDADDDGGLGVEVDHTMGAVVTLRGVGSRENYLRIVDKGTNELFDRKELAGAEITQIELVGTEYERVPTDRTAIVWATGDQEIGVALEGEVQVGSSPTLQRLVDTSMELSMPSAERTAWDKLRVTGALAGVTNLSVTAGDKPAATVPVEFVTGADTMFAIDDPSPTVRPGESIFVCFAAMNGSRYVYGLTWQFNVDGEASTKGKDAVTRNCVSVAAGSRTAGTTIPVAAAAGGQQLNITVTVDAGTMAREHNVGVLHSESELLRTASPLGERAALSM